MSRFCWLPSLASFLSVMLGVVTVAGFGWPIAGAQAGESTEEGLAAQWRVVSRATHEGVDRVVYVKAEKTPGHPAFRIETSFDVVPIVAAATLMDGMVGKGGATTAGETRRVLEHSERGALVHTFVDLPFMFDDREVAIRVEHSADELTGIHRIDWVDQNEILPPVAKGVLRLATKGYWEFRPAGLGRTQAIYMTAAEVGGSFPAALGDRLMRGQAVKAVERLANLLEDRGQTHVAGPPPPDVTLPK